MLCATSPGGGREPAKTLFGHGSHACGRPISKHAPALMIFSTQRRAPDSRRTRNAKGAQDTRPQDHTRATSNLAKRISGALARKRCDPAKKSEVKYGTFGTEVAPFPSERRGPLSDLLPGGLPRSHFSWPSLWKGCGIGVPYCFFAEAKAQGWLDLFSPTDTRVAVATQHTPPLL